MKMMPMHVFGPNTLSDLSRSLEKALKLVKGFFNGSDFVERP
jgi:hypothetical protein